jgi:hypothetical protein
VAEEKTGKEDKKIFKKVRKVSLSIFLPQRFLVGQS